MKLNALALNEHSYIGALGQLESKHYQFLHLPVAALHGAQTPLPPCFLSMTLFEILTSVKLASYGV